MSSASPGRAPQTITPSTGGPPRPANAILPFNPLEEIARTVQRNRERYTYGTAEWADLYLQHLQNPRDAVLNSRLIQYYVNDREDWARAIPHLKQHLARDPRSAEANLLLGTACLKVDDPPEAERCLRAALAAQANNIDAHFYLACSQLLQAKDAEATEHLEAVIELDPGWQDPQVVLVAMHWTKGNADAAQSIIKRGLDFQPNGVARVRLADDVRHGGPPAALNHLKEVLTEHLRLNPRPTPEAKTDRPLIDPPVFADGPTTAVKQEGALV